MTLGTLATNAGFSLGSERRSGGRSWKVFLTRDDLLIVVHRFCTAFWVHPVRRRGQFQRKLASLSP